MTDLTEIKARYLKVLKWVADEFDDTDTAHIRAYVTMLEQALERYGEHDESCNKHPDVVMKRSDDCTCGFSKALEDRDE